MGQRILAALTRQPGQKAGELAAALGVDRREINRCLCGQIARAVRQDQAYRWYPAAHHPQPEPAVQAPVADTELSRMARYYLECIGQDSNKGVSTFAASRFGPPDYAELPALPLLSGDPQWWQAPGAQRILGKISAERGRLAAYIGYPVRLRHHRTPKWEGFFAEPVLLWPVDPTGGQPHVMDDFPAANFAFLKSVAMGDPAQLPAEAAALSAELGLANPPGDQPETDEMLDRLPRIRPDWDWREAVMPEACSTAPLLAEVAEQGIYNRAILCAGERSPYTQGLETELRELAKASEGVLNGTALGAWLGGALPAPDSLAVDPLLEVVPMNTEQRQAVRSALTRPLTVVTGPPGTGKSQVVTNLLVNAAWRGTRVLFASKNNKAVDVVEVRVNELVDGRPALLRLGARDYQAKVAGYMTAMLSGAATPDDQRAYEDALARHRRLADEAQTLEHDQANWLAAREKAGRLAVEVEGYRGLFGADRFRALERKAVAAVETALPAYRHAVDRADLGRMGLLRRLGAALTHKSRLRALEKASAALDGPAAALGVALPNSGVPPNFEACRAATADLEVLLPAARKVVEYHEALGVLRAAAAPEVIARRCLELAHEVADNSTALWADYLRLLPARLTREQRKHISDFAAVLQLLNAAEGRGGVSASVRNRARRLQEQVAHLFSCWAVTSLSARGRIPLVPGLFDLVVIDEASQCDVASALPLLFRAKRAVIIGDPQQLRHISALAPAKDAELQEKHGIADRRAAWMYSTRSLYDLAAGLAGHGDIVNLRDHFRSHAHIIEFSNRHFYADRPLRIATPYNRLRRPRPNDPGVAWQDVPGRAERPAAGGARNPVEAAAVAAFLRDLLLARKYRGTVGVVTPFRAQAQALQEIAASDGALAAAGLQADLLINTVHQFQGDERDLVVFSPVVAPGVGEGALNFLRANGNLFNVAITRARGQLQVIGDMAFAASCGIRYLEQFAAYVTGLRNQPEQPPGGRPEDLGPTYPSVSHPERVSDCERVFYAALYASGVRPIPQYGIEQYDLDFVLVVGNSRLDIELDGKQHRSWTGEQCLRDRLRDMRMIELGWEVKRYPNMEIQDHLAECVAWVATWARQAAAQTAVGQHG